MQEIKKNQLEILITILDHVKSLKLRQQKTTWRQFKSNLLSYYQSTVDNPTSKYKEDGSTSVKYIIAGEFDSNFRTNANIIKRSMLTLDIDEWGGSAEELKEEIKTSFSKYNFMSYSTASCTSENPRARVILPLNEPVLANNFPILARDFIDKIDNKKIRDGIYKDLTSSITANKLAGLYFKPYNTPNYCDFFIENEGEYVPISDYNITSVVEKETDFLRSVGKKPLDLTDEEVRELVFSQDAKSCERDTWIKVGMAIHHQYDGSEQGMKLWNEWSAGDEARYKGIKEIEYYYNKFDNKGFNSVTMGSLLFLKKEKERNLKGADREGFPIFQPLNCCIWQHTQGKKLQPIDSSENFKILLENYNFSVHFNVILKNIDVKYKGKTYHKDLDPSVAIIKSLMNINNFKSGCPKMRLSEVAAFNPINPWKDWIFSKQWDGKSRINDFYNSVEVKSEYEEKKKLYLDKWILQMLHMTCLNDEKEKIARTVLVFQSKEAKQKTFWFRSLACEELKEKYIGIGKQVNLDNHMDKLELISCAIAEFGELDGTFKKSEQAAIKNFITRPEDMINIKYQASHSHYRRRTVFFASVNKLDFLDEIGQNTRFLVLPIEQCHFNHGIDMQQLYAEFLVSKINEQYWLNPEEEKELIETNKEFRNISPIIEKFKHIFNMDLAPDSKSNNYYNLTEILSELGFDNPKRQDMSILKHFLLENNYYFSSKKGKYLLPCKKKQQINDFSC